LSAGKNARSAAIRESGHRLADATAIRPSGTWRNPISRIAIMRKFLLASLLTCAVFGGAAFAQDTTPQSSGQSGQSSTQSTSGSDQSTSGGSQSGQQGTSGQKSTMHHHHKTKSHKSGEGSEGSGQSTHPSSSSSSGM
jgi:hypothetical protein